ncbi:MAG: hypothetical protein WCF16_01465 [Alphaproteobacteria bacterium]
MARLALGPIASDVSGRIGRIVLRRTRYGIVAQSLPPTRVYFTPAAILSKDRFRQAQRAWAIMPQPLKGALADLQRASHLGTPGPWMTTWIAYATTGLWHYRPVANSRQSVAILSITDNDPWWIVSFADNMTPPWDRFWFKLFHPSEPAPLSESWFRFPNMGSPMSFSKSAVPPGSSLLLVPTITGDQTAFGSGDAHLLP